MLRYDECMRREYTAEGGLKINELLEIKGLEEPLNGRVLL